jgi:hypothetical protein
MILRTKTSGSHKFFLRTAQHWFSLFLVFGLENFAKCDDILLKNMFLQVFFLANLFWLKVFWLELGINVQATARNQIVLSRLLGKLV